VADNAADAISEWRTFLCLDMLHATATGLDQLSAWFLPLGAPLFYKPLTHLFILSLSSWMTSMESRLHLSSSPEGTVTS